MWPAPLVPLYVLYQKQMGFGPLGVTVACAAVSTALFLVASDPDRSISLRPRVAVPPTMRTVMLGAGLDVFAAFSQAVSAALPSRRSVSAGLPLLLVCLAGLESAPFTGERWLFVAAALVSAAAATVVVAFVVVRRTFGGAAANSRTTPDATQICDVAVRRRGTVWQSMPNAGRKEQADEIRHPGQG
jgi:hypothetical protein